MIFSQKHFEPFVPEKDFNSTRINPLVIDLDGVFILTICNEYGTYGTSSSRLENKRHFVVPGNNSLTVYNLVSLEDPFIWHFTNF